VAEAATGAAGIRLPKKMAKTLPFLFPEDETFAVGVDTRTPIDDNDYQVPFRFTGKLHQVDSGTATHKSNDRRAPRVHLEHSGLSLSPKRNERTRAGT
jgi:hypothetical protein